MELPSTAPPPPLPPSLFRMDVFVDCCILWRILAASLLLTLPLHWPSTCLPSWSHFTGEVIYLLSVDWREQLPPSRLSEQHCTFCWSLAVSLALHHSHLLKSVIPPPAKSVSALSPACAWCRDAEFPGQLLQKAIPLFLHPHTSPLLFHSLCFGLELLVLNFTLSNEQRSKVTNVTAGRSDDIINNIFPNLRSNPLQGVQSVNWTKFCQHLVCCCHACIQVCLFL